MSVKICGLNEQTGLEAALHGGASHVGFVFYPPSPRNVTVEQAAALSRLVPASVERVGLFVNPDNALIRDAISSANLSLLQLHGSETPEQVARIRAEFGVPVMKALRISDRDDLGDARTFMDVADWLLFDAKPPKGDKALPGGNGISFDWTLLEGFQSPIPWMLGGGLNVDNVAEAIRISGAHAVDVSSGVERMPGQKDPARISAFLSASQAALRQ